MPVDRVTQSRCAMLATLYLLAKDDAMSESVIAELEGRLRKAMLASDVDVLDALLADDLTFVDATGKVISGTYAGAQYLGPAKVLGDLDAIFAGKVLDKVAQNR